MASRIYYNAFRKGTTVHRAYPPDAKVSLYYFMPPENPPSRENYASELHQVMILRLSRVGWTSCEQMVASTLCPFKFLSSSVFDYLDTVLINLNYSRSQLIYTLNVTLVVDLSKEMSQFCFVTDRDATTFSFRNPFVDYRQLWKGTLYTSSSPGAAYYQYYFSLTLPTDTCRISGIIFGGSSKLISSFLSWGGTLLLLPTR